jgi:hypothetical protein
MKPSFILHKDSLSILDELNDEQAGMLFKAIYHYQVNGVLPPDLDFVMRIAISPFVNQFVRDENKYENISERNKENGKKGGRPKKTQVNPNNPVGLLGTQDNPKNPSKPKESHSDSESDSDSEKESDKENDNDKEKNDDGDISVAQKEKQERKESGAYDFDSLNKVDTAKKLFGDEKVNQNIGRHKLSSKQGSTAIQDFVNFCDDNEKFPRNYQDSRSHFYNWIAKKDINIYRR